MLKQGQLRFGYTGPNANDSSNTGSLTAAVQTSSCLDVAGSTTTIQITLLDTLRLTLFNGITIRPHTSAFI